MQALFCTTCACWRGVLPTIYLWQAADGANGCLPIYMETFSASKKSQHMCLDTTMHLTYNHLTSNKYCTSGQASAMLQVALLTDFKDYVKPTGLLKTGGSAILEPELGQIIGSVVLQAQQAEGIKSPSLTGGSEEWNEMVQNIICSSAGLVQFLIDAWPPDLPEYDPL